MQSKVDARIKFLAVRGNLWNVYAVSKRAAPETYSVYDALMSNYIIIICRLLPL